MFSKQETFHAHQDVAVGTEDLENIIRMASTQLPNIFGNRASVGLETIAATVHHGGHLRTLSIQILVHDLIPGDGGKAETGHSRPGRGG